MKATEITRAEYEAAVCGSVDQAVRVPFEGVSSGDWSPKPAECHQNVDAWIRVHPECLAVRGWVTYASFGGDSVGLTAHSVVRQPSGALIDITPLGNEDARAGMRFVEHQGDPVVFDKMKAVGINIFCPDFSVTDLVDVPCQEIFDELGDEG